MKVRQIKRGEAATVSVTIKNTGPLAAAEVVQLYIHDEECSVTRPIKELKSFSKVFLKPGESKQVEFILSKDAFAYWNIDMNYDIDPGDFTIMTGTSSKDSDLKKVILTIK